MAYPHPNTTSFPISLLCTVTPVVGVQNLQPDAPPFYAQPPASYPCAPPFQGQTPQSQGQAPQFQGQAPQFRAQAPQFKGKAPQFQAQAPYYQAQAPQFQVQAPQFPMQAPPCECRIPQFESWAPPFARDPCSQPSQRPVPPHYQQHDRKDPGYTYMQCAPQNPRESWRMRNVAEPGDTETLDDGLYWEDLPPTPAETNALPPRRTHVFEEDDSAEFEENYMDCNLIIPEAIDELNQDGFPLSHDSSVRPEVSARSAPMAQLPDNIPHDQTPRDKKRQRYAYVEEVDESTSGPKTHEASRPKHSTPAPEPQQLPPTPPPKTHKASWSKPSHTQSRVPASKTQASRSKQPPPSSEPQQQQSLSPFLSKKILDRISSNSSIVTHIKVEPQISIATCFDILSRAPAVRTFSVTLGPSPSNDERGSWSDAILRHSLESLSITTCVNPRPLLKALALPSLTRLSVNARKGQFSRNEPLGLYKLLENSECALTRLVLADVYPTRTEFMKCLRAPACATLESLVVRATLPLSAITPYGRRYVVVDTLKDLTEAVGDDGALLCPNLASVELSYCNCFPEHIVEMVKARVARGPFSIKYAFTHPGLISGVVARELTALATTHPLKFMESQVQVISDDR